MKVIRIALLVLPLFFCAASWAQTTYEEHPVDPVSTRVTGLFAADLDQDGDKDFVVCERLKSQVAWWRNDGGSPIQWSRQVVDGAFNRPMYCAVGDLDGDGRPDVIASSAEKGIVAWWRNEGGDPVTWTKAVIQNGFTGAHGVWAADVNGDGAVDVIGASSGLNELAWWENNGEQPVGFTKRTITSSFTGTQSVMAVDIDGDGNLDILGAAIGCDQIAWWRNAGGSPVAWTKTVIDAAYAGAHCVDAGDVDGDGDTDVLGAACANSEVTWWENKGSGAEPWTKHAIGVDFLCALSVQAKDLDNDGDLDAVATSFGDGIVAAWYNGGGSPVQWTKSLVDVGFSGAWPLAVSDLDGDGDQDIAAGADVLQGPVVSASLTWWENRLSSQTGDLNRDGSLTADDAELLKRYLAGNLTSGQPPFIASLDMADINQDHLIDMLDAVLLGKLVHSAQR